ncbi:phospholipase A-2-activating protein [Galendromus occidentalis]|uniref:Phospholipase A-2-activating protein n=1 Tax=Galendromus occidentalis TaxID=34638 RepID=A0AAJ7L8A7_9ACAR|nr:phospholipase A-2-activating protein [Galendromus occidentalis]
MANEEGIANSYMLRANLCGHARDVRVVAETCFPEGGIVTGSRDFTTRIWTYNGAQDENRAFVESHCLKGPTDFVSAVCAMPPSDQFPQGLILVGSHDCNIYCFNLESNSPLYKLLGHSGAVCSLAAGQFGTLVSGSWDKTARVWSGQKCTMTLEGHQGAVWAVSLMPQQGLILTGSADKAIRLWRAGKCEKTFFGHEDCVRGIAVLSTREFLSCSNDATIRHWEVAGDCLHIYRGHTSFVYSIATLEDSDFFVTCGEDRTVRVWTARGSCQQTIRMPCPTVWSVALLANGDIVAGCSDAISRVFTRYEALKASPDAMKSFQEQVASSSLPAQELGDLKTENLPGEEVLNEPGKREGHTILVKEGQNVCAYMWSMQQQTWQKIGDVVGSPDGSSAGGKIMFEGKEYDHVFNVDIDDNAKPLKLPYNLTDDPWITAQAFIHKHGLPQDYLDNVAKFIINNTSQGVTTKSIDPAQSSTEYCDPFTGNSRYVPGTSRAASIDASAPNGSSNDVRHIPYTGKWIAFDIANTSGMLNKLREFNGQVPPENIVKDEQHLDELKDLIECKIDKLEEIHVRTLEAIIDWPNEFIFPALDVLRCAIRSDAVNSFLCTGPGGSKLVAKIVSLITSPAPANRMLALRFFVNMFLREAGQQLAHLEWERILKISSEHGFNGNKNTQIALGSLYLNYVILSNCKSDETNASRKRWLVQSMCEVIPKLSDCEAQFRSLLALGTLIFNDKELCQLANGFKLTETLTNICTHGGESLKLKQCAHQCINHILDFCV